MAELFPEKPPAWLPEVYENVGKIVNKAILTNEVVKLQGDFWGIKEQAVLLDAEAGGTDYRHTLQESVQGPLLRCIGNMIQDDRAEQSLPLYLMAGNLLLAIMKDLGASPSAYAQQSKVMINHAMTTYRNIIDKRVAAVQCGRGDPRIRDAMHDTPGMFYEWHDTVTDIYSAQRYYFGLENQGEWARYKKLQSEDYATKAIEMDKGVHLGGSGMAFYTSPDFNWPKGMPGNQHPHNFASYLSGILGELTEKLGDPPSVCDYWEFGYLHYGKDDKAAFANEYVDRDALKAYIAKNDFRPTSMAVYGDYNTCIPSWKARTSMFSGQPDPKTAHVYSPIPSFRVEARAG
ncbi:hypothetical protein [Mesorhizobium sp.]|uniref:hypothetical protein n=1 Tax=Mesorhizobium sp. TaxID=1871066 RepID=UPI000FE5C593|nr:hypothetical protein [Mesorhizobium sp.]RWN60401.1 MAG: hypothetical protein EOS00_14205 [Mesorhizobium sp.]